MKIELKMDYIIEVEKCDIDYLTGVFKQLLVNVFTDFVRTVQVKFAESFMGMEEKPFSCKCGNRRDFIEDKGCQAAEDHDYFL